MPCREAQNGGEDLALPFPTNCSQALQCVQSVRKKPHHRSDRLGPLTPGPLTPRCCCVIAALFGLRGRGSAIAQTGQCASVPRSAWGVESVNKMF
ncbi:hypothetical protein AAFF_G00122160 [Aldrovandia affinis]|uniref:Uncharacterized protein n=1 Tax=Aldrovandia affinis TaxID=143900 RepID=A0AAD7RUF2_9TELE|nr:hypothetical protein AAFF_G00122160 [Aldrovandia affinis]